MSQNLHRASRSILAALVLAGLGAGAPSSSVWPAETGRHVQIESGGHRLNGWFNELEDPVATVLMLHGTMAHANMEIMATLAEVFAEYGIETLRITLSLGLDDRYGMLDCDVVQRHAHTDATEEVGRWFEWLRDRGRRSVLLLGHSRGTNQVAGFAADPQSFRPAGLILVAPVLWAPGRVSTAYAERAGTPLEPLLAEAWALTESGDGGQIIGSVAFLHCPEAEVSAASFLSYYRDDPDFDTLALIDRLDVPVFVFAGSEDPLTEDLEPAVEALQAGERVRLATIDGADHFFRDLYAYDLVEAVLPWIEALREDE